MQNKLFFLFLLSLFVLKATAQDLPLDRNTSIAVVKHTRTQTGMPGKNYWQNKADYQLDINFDPSSREITGTALIAYENNSPDTLKKLVFKLYPNLYKDNSMRNAAVSPDDLTGGVVIEDLEIDHKAIENKQRSVRGTNMFIKGVGIHPQQHISIKVTYHYILNKGSFIRTGQIDTGTLFVAYFFPRVAVYDDVDGWNEYDYLGKEEFYNDYGDFKANITVPGKYCVWATGDLQNAGDTFAPEIVERLRKAELSDGVTDIITAKDLAAGKVTNNKSFHTWKFEARNVTDLAFAVSDNYIWKASGILVDQKSKRRTRVDAVYHPDHKTYLHVVEYARKTVDLISHSLPGIAFPYPHITIVDGLDAMEYPMMVNNLPFEDEKDVVEFTAHEVFHTIFPFYVGTNETKYSFMDEGWATMTEFLFHPLIAPGLKLEYDISPVNDYAGLAEDVPIMTPTAQLYGKARFADKDLKPALALFYLKEMLGEKKIIRAMQYYINTWAGKHPTPYEFFNCMNAGANENLNWYWKKWYFEKAVPDLAIHQVNRIRDQLRIRIVNKGGAPVPVHLVINFKTTGQKTITKTAAIWKKGNRDINISIKHAGSISKITLGNAMDADVNPKDNLYVR
ncbi:MAG: M1 family metallopeptidase [Mucilaginibacter sp.]|nr:M1 family metallopeptidase [Mucilaginibacter sp.]